MSQVNRTVVAWFALVAWLTVMAIWAWPLGRYSPDSWMYWDMAQNIQDGNAFSANTVRQFQSRPGLATSFPIGYPFVLALIERVVPVGARVGIVVNIAMLLIAAALLHRHLRPAGQHAYGPTAVLALSLFLPFTDEVVAGRAMPMAFAMIVTLLILVNRAKTRLSWIAVGAWSGLGVLVRFDMLPIMILTALAVGVLRRIRPLEPQGAPTWSNIGLMCAAAVASVTFVQLGTTAAAGEPIPSDNIRTIVATFPTFVLDYLPDGVETLVEAPGAWVRRLAGNGGTVAYSIYAAGVNGIVPFLVLIAVHRRRVEDTGLFIPAIALGLIAFSVVSGLMLATGYGDTRYWTPFVVAVCIACLAAPGIPRVPTSMRVAALVLAVMTASRLFPVGDIGDAWAARRSNPLASPAIEGLETRCLASSDRVMLRRAGDATRLATIERIRASARPSNLADLDASLQLRLVREFGITHVHDDAELLADFLLETGRTPCEGLLQILP